MYQGVCRLKFTCRIRFCYSFCRRESRNMRFDTIYFKSPRKWHGVLRVLFLVPRAFPHIWTCLCFWVVKFTALLCRCVSFLLFAFLRTHSSKSTSLTHPPSTQHKSNQGKRHTEMFFCSNLRVEFDSATHFAAVKSETCVLVRFILRAVCRVPAQPA